MKNLFTKKSSRKSNRSLSRRSPRYQSRIRRRRLVESLEQRQLLAGDLDLSFDTDGKTSVAMENRSGTVHDVAVQNDGKIVVVGSREFSANDTDFHIVRFNVDGSVDFQNGDSFDRGNASDNDDATAVAIQSDGQILVAGNFDTGTQRDVGVTRFLADGSSGAKIAEVDFGGVVNTVSDMVIQPDGKIIIVGTRETSATDSSFAIARLNADGSFDTSFDADGKKVVDFDLGGTNTFDRANGVALLPDGRIVVVGSADNGDGNTDIAIALLQSSGAADTTFDDDGRLTIAVNFGQDSAAAVAVDGDGKIVIASTIQRDVIGDSDIVVHRLNDNGSIDTGFSGDGRAFFIPDIGQDNTDVATGIAISPDGQILISGTSDAVGTDNTDFIVGRLTSDGQRDGTFGTNAISVIPFDLGGNNADASAGIAFDPSGKIVVAGTVATGTRNHIGVARLFNQDLTTTEFDDVTATVQLIHPNGDEEEITLTGSASIAIVEEGPAGQQTASDDAPSNGLDELETLLLSLNLTGTNAANESITVTLSDTLESFGFIEEVTNVFPGSLEVGPNVIGSANSVLEVFFSASVAGQTLVNDQPMTLSQEISNLRIAPGNRMTGTTVALNDSATSSASGFSLGFSEVVLIPSDFGDAPDLGPGTGTGDYETLLENGGPSHILVDGGPRLGVAVDGELDATASATADADDTTGDPDDEDGVVLPDFLVAGDSGEVTITVNGADGTVQGWIDFNQDGDFQDPGEEILDEFVGAGTTDTFAVAIPADATIGNTYARFRVSDGGAGPTGEVIGGEVEDYAVQIKGLDYGDAPSSLAFDRFVDPNPSPGNDFGSQVVPLATGNVVITAPFDDAAAENAGAVYLFNGQTGELISTLTGSTAGDRVGSFGVTPLEGGNYVVRSVFWNNGDATNAGAVTFGSGTTGVTGEVSETNSLVGTTANDRVGDAGVTPLEGGNYVVRSPFWDNGAATDAGAVTFGSGTTGITGEVSVTNSLVGTRVNDFVGSSGVTPLEGGNYVVRSDGWNNGAATDAGAVTFGSGTTGVVGPVTAANSLVGTTASDQVGSSGVTPLEGGNYVVISPFWNGAANDAGAVTFGNGTTGVTGEVSATNSLVGTTANDQVGFFGVTALEGGNYVVISPEWNNGAATRAGAVTFGSGTTGVTGEVSAANSLVGTTANDFVGFSGVTPLEGGNYVVRSPEWDKVAAPDAGAVTFGSGTTGITGEVSAANSLVGTTANDRVGSSGVTPLEGGNYIVISPVWDNGAAADAGAVTFGNGTTGITGEVSAANSLVGTTASDQVGRSGVTALEGGNYVVRSPFWDNGAAADAGAVTFGSGTTGVVGPVSEANSLVGTTASDQVGNFGVTPLEGGNYVVISSDWNNGAATRAGAVTFGSGTTGATGPVSETNSLVGTTANDRVGISGVTPLEGGAYVVRSSEWDNGAATNAGAVTFGSGTSGIVGPVNAANSLIGSGTNVTTDENSDRFFVSDGRRGVFFGTATDGFADNYDTFLIEDGARHVAMGPMLGSERTTEPDAVSSFPFEDISGTGTAVLGGADDAAITLSAAELNGFTFPFAGQTFDEVHFSTNGLITFESQDDEYDNTDLADVTQPAIAAFWDDLDADSNGEFFWEVKGAGADQRLIIQWHEVEHHDIEGEVGSSTVTFQAILSPDGTIWLNYQDLDFGDARFDGGASATVGFTDGTNSPSLFSLNNFFSNGPLSIVSESGQAFSEAGDQGDDGITFSTPIVASGTGVATASVDVDLQNADGTSNLLSAWIDFNADGDWTDPGEQVLDNFDLGTADGIQTVSFDIPQDTGANVRRGETFARFRLSTAGDLGHAGLAADGEVEDYLVTIRSEAVGEVAPIDNMQPFYAVNYAVAVEGILPDNTGGTPHSAFADAGQPLMGEIISVLTSDLPDGYLWADGRELQIADHTALFSLLGTTFGGDGQTTFALPDLRGRTPIQVGAGDGLPEITWGQELGSETITLTNDNLPSHQHFYGVPTSSVGSDTPTSIDNTMPALGLHSLIDSNGEIRWIAFNFAAEGFAFPNGQELLAGDAQDLFDTIGTTWGDGDGSGNSFNLPDLRGRSVVEGTAGSFVGEAMSALLPNSVGNHNHDVAGTNDSTTNVGGNTIGANVQLSGDQEVPAVTTDAEGTALFTFDTNTFGFDLDLFVQGLELTDQTDLPELTAAHIHEGPSGTNGGVIVDLLADGSFVEVDGGLRLTLRDTFFNGSLTDLTNNNLYFNIHSSANPGGELRGQIVTSVTNFHPTVQLAHGVDGAGQARLFAGPALAGLSDPGGLTARTMIGVGTGDGLTNRTLSEMGGSTLIQVNEDQLPSHSHDLTLPTFPLVVTVDTDGPIDFDDADISLREAIAITNGIPGLQEITFDPSVTMISLTDGDLEIFDSVDITGPGADLLTIEVADGVESRIFATDDSFVGTLTVSGVTLSGAEGGAIKARNATELSVVGVVFDGNSANTGAGIDVGDSSTGVVRNSLFINNVARSNGSAIQADGERLLVSNSTFSGNTSDNSVIYVENGDLTIVNATIFGNQGAGILGDNGSVELNNTILAQNDGGSFVDDGFTITSLGGNLSGDDGGGFLTASGDQINTDPLLEALADNGGPTMTHSPSFGSDAIDSGLALPQFEFEFDQRGDGFPRSQDGDADGTAAVDIGAIERINLPNIEVDAFTNGQDADSAPGPAIAVGGIATFGYSVTNTGNMELDNVTVLDDNGTPSDTTDDVFANFFAGDTDLNGLLSPGETWDFELLNSRTVTPGQFTNTATVTADPVDGNGGALALSPVTASDSSNHFGSQDMDFGDAPSVYPVTTANGGASHVITSLFLGDTVDAEADGDPLQDATGDVDDGVLVIADAVAVAGSATTASFSVIASEVGMLDAWIDFNQDGDWDDPGEQIATSLALAAGTNTLGYTIPAGALAGETFARFRVSNDGGLSPGGATDSGEVEDYSANLLDGAASPTALVDILETAATIINENGQIIIRGASTDLFSVPVDAVGGLDVETNDNDSELTLDLGGGDVVPTGGQLIVNGLGGNNTLRVLGGAADLDFTNDGNIQATNFQTIDLSDPSAAQLTLNSGAVNAIASGGVLDVIGDADDNLIFEDPDNWRMGATSVRDGQFIREIVNVSGTESFEADLPFGWHNLANPLDTDNSGGELTPFDALQGINLLSARQRDGVVGDALPDPASLAEFPENNWIDTDGNGNITPFDVLNVINGLSAQERARQNPDGEGEQVVVDFGNSVSVIAPSQTSPLDLLAGNDPRSEELVESPLDTKVASFWTNDQDEFDQADAQSEETSLEEYTQAVDELLSDVAGLL